MSFDERRGELLLAEVTVPQTELATAFQEVGQNAWTAQPTGRTPEEIAYVYNPNDPYHIEVQAEAIRTKAENGGVYLALARAHGEDTTLIGYTAAFENVSGSGLFRVLKDAVRHPHYMEISVINVVSGAQGKGHGSRLLIELTNRFGEELHPTAYVFDENQAALGFFRRRGFEFDPPLTGKKAQKPRPQKDYFGPGTDPAMMWRLEMSEGAGQLRTNLNARATSVGHAAPEITVVDQHTLNQRLAHTRARRS